MLLSPSPRTQALRLGGGTQTRHRSQHMAAPLRDLILTIITSDGRIMGGRTTRSVLAVQDRAERSASRGLAYGSLSTSSEELLFHHSQEIGCL